MVVASQATYCVTASSMRLHMFEKKVCVFYSYMNHGDVGGSIENPLVPKLDLLKKQGKK